MTCLVCLKLGCSLGLKAPRSTDKLRIMLSSDAEYTGVHACWGITEKLLKNTPELTVVAYCWEQQNCSLCPTHGTWHLLTWDVLAQGRGSLTCSQVPGWATNCCPGAAVWGCASCCGGAVVKQLGCDPGDPEWTTSGCLTARSTCCSPCPSAGSCASSTVVTDKSSPSRSDLVSSVFLLK